MPIIVVGMARIRNEHTSLRDGQHAERLRREIVKRDVERHAASSRSGDSRPVTPIRISAMPNAASGDDAASQHPAG